MTNTKLELFIRSKKTNNSDDPKWNARDVFTLMELKDWRRFKQRILRLPYEESTSAGKILEYIINKETTEKIIKGCVIGTKTSDKVAQFKVDALEYLSEQQVTDNIEDGRITRILSIVLNTQSKNNALEADIKALRVSLGELSNMYYEVKSELADIQKVKESISPADDKTKVSELKKRIAGSIKQHFNLAGNDMRYAYRTANSAVNEDRFVFDGNKFKTIPKFGELYYTKSKAKETIELLKEYERRIEEIIIGRIEETLTR